VFGLPRYDPRQQRRDESLAAIKKTFDSFVKYRCANDIEAESLYFHPPHPVYVPDLPPLGRAATAEDVKAGKEIFHLDGRGRMAKLDLPAAASLVKPGQKVNDRRSSRRVMILQAEVNADGNLLYGIVGDGPGRIAKPSELTDIKPIKKVSWFQRLFD
jgi:hypothetical protein